MQVHNSKYKGFALSQSVLLISIHRFADFNKKVILFSPGSCPCPLAFKRNSPKKGTQQVTSLQ